MKRIIINISKDTPTETINALCGALKTQNKKSSKYKQSELYLLNEDIEKLHERYDQLFKQVKTSQNLSEEQIKKECDTLSEKYDFELDELSKLRKVDYDIKLAEIEQREHNIKPWRRCWLWKLLFRPLTNRAQDIIEERAELDANIEHRKAEKAIEDERKKLPVPDSNKKPSKRKLKRIMKNKLKAVIEKADTADMNEAFNEPQNADSDVPPVQENSDTAAPMGDAEPAKDSPQVQLRLDELLTAPKRRPRPPRSCRKPS